MKTHIFQVLLKFILFLQLVRLLAQYVPLDLVIMEQLVSFKLQLTVLSFVLSVLFLYHRAFKLFSFALLAIVLDVVPLLAFYMPSKEVSLDGTCLKIIHANVYYENNSKEKIVSLIKSENPDLVFLLELNKLWGEQLTALKQYFPYHIQYGSRPVDHALILSKRKLINPRVVTLVDPHRQVFFAKIALDKERQATVVALHLAAPLNSYKLELRNRLLKAVTEEVKKINGPIIMLGDFNTSPWSYRYREFMHKTRLKNCREGFGLLNSWGIPYTPIWIPIDHILVSKDIKVKNCTRGEDIGSDHLPLIAEVQFDRSHGVSFVREWQLCCPSWKWTLE